MLKRNWNWKNNRLFCHISVIGKISIGGRPALLSQCFNCGKQKRYLQIFREVSGVFQQNFNGSKNNAVLEPRTGQFSRTLDFEAKAKDLRLWGQGQGRPRGLNLWKTGSTVFVNIRRFLRKHNVVSRTDYIRRICYKKLLKLVENQKRSSTLSSRRFNRTKGSPSSSILAAYQLGL